MLEPLPPSTPSISWRLKFVRVQASLSALLLLASLAAHTGCVSTRQYRLSGKDTAPPVPLNFSVSQLPAEVTLHTVVVFKGPGSWKSEAYWDEYIVTLTNRGETPLMIESAVLIDLHGQPVAPGSDPWSLERLSKDWLKKNPTAPSGIPVELGVHPVLKAGAYAFAGAVSTFGWFIVGVGGVGVVSTAGAVVLAWPAYALTAVAVNSSNQKLVAAEFTRRRLVLPAEIATGQMAQGSLFFRVSPGPQRLLLRCSAGDRVQEIAVDLSPLGGLHLKPTGAALSSSSASAKP